MSVKRSGPSPLPLALLLAGLSLLLTDAGAIDLEATRSQIDRAPVYIADQIWRSESPLPDAFNPVQCGAAKQGQAWGLGELVDQALCHNAQIRVSWALLKVQAAAVGEVRATAYPVVSATSTRLRTRTEYPDLHATSNLTGQAAYVSLNWRLFDFGGQQANQGAANSLLLAALASRDETIQKVLASTVEAYFDVLSMRAGLHAMEQSEANALDLLRSAQRRGKNGLAARSDILQAQTAYAKATLEKNRIAASLNKAMSVLAYVIGMDPGAQLSVAGTVFDEDGERRAGSEAGLTQVTSELQQLLHDAEVHHPSLAAAKAQLLAAEFHEKSVRADGLPTVDMAANYNQNGYPGQGLSNSRTRVGSIGLSVTFPLFNGFAQTYRLREANAQMQQRRFELDETRHNVLTEIIKSHADALAALQNLSASRELLDAARQALDSSTRRYELGAADIQEILSTQHALNDAELERVRCLGEWRSTRLRLLASAGQLSREAVRE